MEMNLTTNLSGAGFTTPSMIGVIVGLGYGEVHQSRILGE